MSSLRVIYLGKLAEVAGRPESEFSSSSGEMDWLEFLAVLEGHVCPEIADAARDPATKIALNGGLETDREGLTFRMGDEVALLPPVSGG